MTRVHLRFSGTPGDRPSALFIHGHFGSSRTWHALTSQLAGQVNCVAVDLPGFGRTPPPASYSTEAMAETVAGVAAALSDEPVHVVGNSYGGTIALWLTARHPGLVRTLTLLSPAVSLSPIGLTARKCVAMLGRLCLGDTALRRLVSGKDATELAHAVLDECRIDKTSVNPAVLDGAVQDALEALNSPWRIAAEARSFRAMAGTLVQSYLPFGPSLRRMARQITVPTAIVWGECDDTVPVRHARKLSRLIPSARLTVVHGVGHLPHFEAPQRVAAIIQEHITAHTDPDTDRGRVSHETADGLDGRAAGAERPRLSGDEVGDRPARGGRTRQRGVPAPVARAAAGYLSQHQRDPQLGTAGSGGR